MFQRRLGKSGIEVSGLGMGCWAIGGPWLMGENPAGWGQVDDAESLRAIHCALDLGINFFDTAANYGAGHSERLLGQALAGRRDRVIIATKFGYQVDEDKKVVWPRDDVVGWVRQECEDSLRRLNTDYIDLYQFHVGAYEPAKAGEVREELEKLVTAGKIRWYGWSTDNPEGARVFAAGKHCTAIQHRLNMTVDAPAILAVCDEFDLASINRSPLGMGLLTGKFTPDTQFQKDDIRGGRMNLRDGEMAEHLKQVDRLRRIFGKEGRTLAQLALAWIWARSERTIPIPGFKTVAQVQENVKAMAFPPLTRAQVRQIDQVFGRG